MTRRGAATMLEGKVTATRASTGPLLDGVAVLLAFSALAFGGVYDWGVLTLQLGSAVLFAAWCFLQMTTGEVVIVPSSLYWPVLGFAGVVAAQLAGGRTAYTYATQTSALDWLAYSLLAFVAVQCLDDRAQRNRLLPWMALFGAGVAAFAVVQKLAPNGRIYWFWPTRWPTLYFGPYVNHAHYSGLMELLAPAALVLALRRSVRLEVRLAWGAAAALMLASVVLSGSRGGMLAIAVELVAMAWFLARTPNIRRTLGGIAVIALLSFGLVAWLDNGDLAHRLQSIPALEQEGRSATRMTIARDTWHMAAARPLLGWGLGTFQYVYPQFRSFPTELLVDHAHNDYLELVAETGTVGAALLLWFLVAIFRGARDALERWHFRDSGAGLTLAALVGCGGLLTHSLTDFNLHIPANAVIFFVLCGAAAYRPQPETVELPSGFVGRERDAIVIDAEPALEAPAEEPIP